MAGDLCSGIGRETTCLYEDDVLLKCSSVKYLFKGEYYKLTATLRLF